MAEEEAQMKKWEVWFADAPFDNGRGSKVRPVLVLRVNGRTVNTFKITSREPRTRFPAEYSIVHWGEAGLYTPSTIRGSEILEIERSRFMDKVGSLQEEDIRNLRKIIREEKPEYSHLVEKFIPDDDPQIDWIEI